MLASIVILVTLIIFIILISIISYIYLKKNKEARVKAISFFRSVLKLSLIPEIIIFVIGVPICIVVPMLNQKTRLIPSSFLMLLSFMMICYSVCNFIVAVKNNYQKKTVENSTNNSQSFDC